MSKTFFCIVLAGLLAQFPLAAHAYIGPGAGLSAIGTLIALIGAVLLAIVGFLWYPIKRLLRGHKTVDAKDNPDDGAQ